MGGKRAEAESSLILAKKEKKRWSSGGTTNRTSILGPNDGPEQKKQQPPFKWATHEGSIEKRGKERWEKFFFCDKDNCYHG